MIATNRIVTCAQILLLSTVAHAQSPVRDPTPAERKVLEQYRDVIHSVLDSFDSDDWDTKIDYDVDDNIRSAREMNIRSISTNLFSAATP